MLYAILAYLIEFELEKKFVIYTFYLFFLLLSL